MPGSSPAYNVPLLNKYSMCTGQFATGKLSTRAKDAHPWQGNRRARPQMVANMAPGSFSEIVGISVHEALLCKVEQEGERRGSASEVSSKRAQAYQRCIRLLYRHSGAALQAAGVALEACYKHCMLLSNSRRPLGLLPSVRLWHRFVLLDGARPWSPTLPQAPHRLEARPAATPLTPCIWHMNASILYILDCVIGHARAGVARHFSSLAEHRAEACLPLSAHHGAPWLRHVE